MARLEAIVTGTNVVPIYGRALFDSESLRTLADQLTGRRIPMLLDHDLDQPIEVAVVSAEIRPGADGEELLFVEYDVPDAEVAKFGERIGMSIGFTGPAILSPADEPPRSMLAFDPLSFTPAEVAVAAQRLGEAGLLPEVRPFYQLSELPPPLVLLDFLGRLPEGVASGLLVSAITEGLRVFFRRSRPTRFRFAWRASAADEAVVAEIETSSEAAFREALRSLTELEDRRGGSFVREVHRKRWREAGKGRRRRPKP